MQVRPGTPAGRAAGPPLCSLDRALLDAVDAMGRITYYRAADRQGPARRRVVRGVPYDEAFGRGGRGWWPAGMPLPASPEQAAEFGVVWLDEVEAAALIWAAMADGGRAVA